MKKLKAILFDLDNTLYDYDFADQKGMDALYKEFLKDKELSFEEFKVLYKKSKEEVKRELIGMAASHNRILYLQRLTEKVHKTVTPDRILTLYHAYWDTLVENAKLFDGVIEFFKLLQSKKISIILVTNLTTYVQLRKIHNLGIGEYVDYLVTSEEAGYDKPHPAPFLLALHKANLLPEDVIMIGDSMDTDMEGAEALGITTIHYRFGGDIKDSNCIADYNVKSYEELTKLLDIKEDLI